MVAALAFACAETAPPSPGAANPSLSGASMGGNPSQPGGGVAGSVPANGGVPVAAGSAGTIGGGGTPGSQPEPGDPSFSAVTASATTLGQYETLGVSFKSSIGFENPFDAADIQVDLVARAPDGSDVVVPAFFTAGVSGDASWQAYFTPRALGRFEYRLRVTRAGTSLVSDQQRLEVQPSDRDGFLHLAPDTFYNLVFDSGKRFRGVGENYGWETDKYKFADMLPRLAQHQVNFVRTWEGPGRYALQHGQPLSHFDQAVATKLDQVMALAAETGIYVMSTLEPAIYFLTTAHGGDQNIQWAANPFSTAKGGPCATTADFFTNETAKRHYKNKLRYAIARWGHSPYLAVWELWNEYDHLVEQLGVSTASIAAWHQEMGRYLADTDPYDRIVTTSLSHNDYADLWSLPEMQLTQRHLYGAMDGILGTHQTYEDKYRKPFVAGEFSLDWRWPLMHTPAAYGREVHMAMWRGLFAPTPILPMTWWWDFHADNEQYFHFTHVATLAAKTTLGPGPLEPQPATASGGLDVLALKSPAGRVLWLHNRGGSTVSGASVTLGQMPDGSYGAQSLDTWTGAWGAATVAQASGGTLTLPLPSLSADRDVAYWLATP